MLAGQLLAFVRRFVADGGAVILISHLLGEILDTADRIVVMRDGTVVAERAGGRVHPRHRWSPPWAASPRRDDDRRRRATLEARARARRVARARPAGQTDGAELVAHRGEVVGLAGLGGQGQTEMLPRIFRRRAAPRARGDASASRWRWSPATARPTASSRCGRSPKNITIGSLRGMLPRPPRSTRGSEAAMAEDWRERIDIRTPDVDNNILSLSGGNQQKALFARALGSDAEIVLMDDPMRGVDIGTKQEVYGMIRAEADRRPDLHLVHDRDGRAEALRPRLRVPRTGASSPTSPRGELTEEKVLHSSFAEGGMIGTLLSPRLLAQRCCRRCRSPILLGAIFYLQPRAIEHARLQPDVQPRGADRAGDDRPDVRDHASTTSTCRSAPMSASSPASPRPGCYDTPLLGHRRRWPAASSLYMRWSAR